MKNAKEKYISPYSIEELLKTNGGDIPDEEYTEKEDPEELGYDEMTLEEFAMAYQDSISNDGDSDKSSDDDDDDDDDDEDEDEDDLLTGKPRKTDNTGMSKSYAEIVERLNKLPMARDIYFRERKKNLDEGFFKRNVGVLPNDVCEVNMAETWDERMEILKDAMDMAARQLMTNPDTKRTKIEIAKRDGFSSDKIREIRKLGMIDVDKLISSLEQVGDIITDAYEAPKDLMYDIQDTNRILIELCQRVLEDYTNYDVEDLEKIIDWMNKNSKYSSYLGLYKQIYFDFVIKFANELLKHKQDVGDVFIRALNFMIKTNSRVLNVIIKEKNEDFAPVAKYVQDLKKNNRL